jgi:hypothetical protein
MIGLVLLFSVLTLLGAAVVWQLRQLPADSPARRGRYPPC